MMHELQRELQRREGDIVELLGRFVRCESPSHHKAAVDRLGRIVASEWRRRGAKVRVLRLVFSIVIAALAVEMIFNGITGRL